MKNTAGSERMRSAPPTVGASGGRAMLAALALTAVAGLVCAAAGPVGQSRGGDGQQAAPSLDEARLTLGKWIETQQIISKERKEWQQGKEILLGRLELIRQEVNALKEKIAQASSGAAEVDAKRTELVAEYDEVEAANARLHAVVSGMESEVRRLASALPEPTRARVQMLLQRLPEDPSSTAVSAPERFQNVLGFLNELNKANNEINVSYEVRQMADGRPAEVKVLYVGLAQAYYVSASGEAGIGRPSPEGWQWEPSKAIAGEVLTALEILQGKHTPAFVPLPVRVQ